MAILTLKLRKVRNHIHDGGVHLNAITSEGVDPLGGKGEVLGVGSACDRTGV